MTKHYFFSTSTSCLVRRFKNMRCYLLRELKRLYPRIGLPNWLKFDGTASYKGRGNILLICINIDLLQFLYLRVKIFFQRKMSFVVLSSIVCQRKQPYLLLRQTHEKNDLLKSSKLQTLRTRRTNRKNLENYLKYITFKISNRP